MNKRPAELSDVERREGYVGHILGVPAFVESDAIARAVRDTMTYNEPRSEADVIQRVICAHEFTRLMPAPYEYSAIRFCAHCGIAQFPVAE